MTTRYRNLGIATTALLFLAVACKKDELTVVSTATAHTCARTIFQLNIDSLLGNGPGGPGDTVLNFTMCECDTIGFVPVLTDDYEFEHWVIDQGEENASQEEEVLDSITVESELWLDVEDHSGPEPPHHEHVRILVHTEPCD